MPFQRGFIPVHWEVLAVIEAKKTNQKGCPTPRHRLYRSICAASRPLDVTLPVLSLLPAAAQRDELARSREVLERELGVTVLSAAYPYGTRSDVSGDTVRATRDSGFDFAMANEPGSAWRGSSRWRVPRHLVRDWDAPVFEEYLNCWFAD